jgi:hypothetical protein
VVSSYVSRRNVTALWREMVLLFETDWMQFLLSGPFDHSRTRHQRRKFSLVTFTFGDKQAISLAKKHAIFADGFGTRVGVLYFPLWAAEQLDTYWLNCVSTEADQLTCQIFLLLFLLVLFIEPPCA